MDPLKSLLEKLHIKTVEELLKRIESGDATAAEFAAAIKLLKDNEIVLARLAGNEAAKFIADKLLPFALPEVPPSEVQ